MLTVSQRSSRSGFTLVELLVSMGVLVLLVLLIGQLFSAATVVATTGNKQLDAEEAARPLFERMQTDFTQMVKRSDVDYVVKDSTRTQVGNDQISFFAQVDGYSSGSPGPISLVSYRVNSDSTNADYSKLERMGAGLLWNGASTTDIPVVYLPLLISDNWPAAASTSTADPNYDLAGPQVFRFEYWYLLKNGTVSVLPWDSTQGHSSVNGFQDVAALGVAVAVVDPRSRALVTDAQLATLAGTMNDFVSTNTPGTLQAQWQSVLNASTLPHPAVSAMRIFRRYFYLNSPPSTQ